MTPPGARMVPIDFYILEENTYLRSNWAQSTPKFNLVKINHAIFTFFLSEKEKWNLSLVWMKKIRTISIKRNASANIN